MDIPWDDIKAKFNDGADELIDTINASDITIFYSPQAGLSDAEGDLSVKPYNFDAYGGRVPLQSMTDRSEESGSNLVNTPANESIVVRAYWISKSAKSANGDKSFVLFDQRLKIIAYTTDMIKLSNAIYIDFQGIQLKNADLPKPYGFGKRYCVSYWEAMNG